MRQESVMRYLDREGFEIDDSYGMISFTYKNTRFSIVTDDLDADLLMISIMVFIEDHGYTDAICTQISNNIKKENTLLKIQIMHDFHEIIFELSVWHIMNFTLFKKYFYRIVDYMLYGQEQVRNAFKLYDENLNRA